MYHKLCRGGPETWHIFPPAGKEARRGEPWEGCGIGTILDILRGLGHPNPRLLSATSAKSGPDTSQREMLPHPAHGEIQGSVECGEEASVLVCFPIPGDEGDISSGEQQVNPGQNGEGGWAARSLFPLALPQKWAGRGSGSWVRLLCDSTAPGARGTAHVAPAE